MKKLFEELSKPLGIEDIDFRVQSVNKGGYAIILAYKDARVDMNRLDQVVRPENWQRDHKEIKGVMYGGIGIKCGDDWVWKWDAGTESQADAEKGESSDSFKRAGFNWNIGRELYDYPLISVKLNPDEFDKAKGRPTWKFKLREWKWIKEVDNNGKITTLEGYDQNGVQRYAFGKKAKKPELPKITKDQYEKAIEYVGSGGSVNAIIKKYKLTKTQEDKLKNMTKVAQL